MSYHRRKIKPTDANGGLTLTTTLSKIDLAGEARQAVKLRGRAAEDSRKKSNRDFWPDDERRRWARGATPYELILSYGLYSAERYDLTADVLLPALDTLYTDASAIEVAVDAVTIRLGYQMLSAFAGDRDYGVTLRYAKRIVQDYPDSRFAACAKGLSPAGGACVCQSRAS